MQFIYMYACFFLISCKNSTSNSSFCELELELANKKIQRKTFKSQRSVCSICGTLDSSNYTFVKYNQKSPMFLKWNIPVFYEAK